MSPSPPGRWTEVRAIFEEVVELPRDERASAVHRRCGTDGELRRAVEGLLAADAGAAGFLVPSGVAAPLGGNDPLAAVGADVVIGGFTVQRLIAAGGMGAVYQAEQARPRRAVALKVLRPELCTGDTLRRFHVEAEILGRLQHPGIAEIHAAGVHEAQAGPFRWAMPWYAMELMEGAGPITRHADAAALDVNARVDLLRKVCIAVHHAHLKGVIHRDLKPGNVLVDAAGAPKVIDFGVARATTAGLDGDTMPGVVLGTPSYMAPEQYSGNGGDVDVRCDVFALGVILYELVCGQLPFAGAPRTPEEARALFAAPPANPRALRPDLGIELEWILLKAIAVERERRYETAAAFADDLGRFLRHESVAAAPPSRTYYLQKALRRHRGLVAAAAAVLLSLAAGQVATSLALARARDAEAKARDEKGDADRARTSSDVARARAVDASRKSDGVLRLLQAAIGSARGRKRGEDVTIADFCAELALRLEADASVPDYVRAAVCNYLGELHFRNGEYALGEGMFRRSLEHLAAAEQLGTEDGVRSHGALSETLRLQGQHAEAAAELAQAIDLADQVLAADDPFRLSLRRRQAFALLERGATDPAVAELRDLLRIRLARFGDRSPEVAESRSDLVAGLLTSGRFAESEPAAREALATCNAAFGRGSEKALNALSNLGAALIRLGRPAEAEPLLGGGVDAANDAVGPGHPATLCLQEQHAQALLALGRAAPAAEMFAALLAARRTTLPQHDRLVLTAAANLADALNEAGRPGAAEAAARPYCTDVPGAPEPVVRGIIAVRRARAHALRALARPAEAEAELRASHDLAVLRLGGTHTLAARLADELAELCAAAGRAEDAAEWRKRSGTAARGGALDRQPEFAQERK